MSKKDLSDLEKRILDQSLKYPDKRSELIATEEGTTEGNVNKTKSNLRKLGLLVKKGGIQQGSIINNDGMIARREETIQRSYSSGLTPEQRAILFKRRQQGDEIEKILAENPAMSAQAATAEIEAVQKHRDWDIHYLQKVLLDEIGTGQGKEYLSRHPDLRVRFESLSAELKTKGRLSNTSFQELFELYGEIGFQFGRLAAAFPDGRPLISWRKITCIVCGEPIEGVALDASTSFGKEVLNQFANRSHSECLSFLKYRRP